jgi:putative heme transporter
MERVAEYKAEPVRHKKRAWQVLSVIVSLAIVVAIFGLVIPKIADYGDVFSTIASLTWLEIVSLVVVMAFNLVTYWPQQVAAMPGLTLGQAAVNNQTTTTIADLLPGGAAIAVGFGFVIYRSWGFTKAQIALQAMVTGIWNIYMKLAMPVLALVVLAFYGHTSPGLIFAAVIGVAVLAVSIVLFAMILWKKSLARRIGSGIGRFATLGRRLFRKPPAHEWGEAAVRLRKQTIGLVVKQWIPLTGYTLLSHTALFLTLLLSLRHVGISEQEVSWAEIFGVFAFVRLLSALPLTPGGVGIVELGYIGGLNLAGGDHAQVVAGVLLFRLVSYGLQIPLGGITYVIWRRKKSWFKTPPDHVTPVPEPVLVLTGPAAAARVVHDLPAPAADDRST